MQRNAKNVQKERFSSFLKCDKTQSKNTLHRGKNNNDNDDDVDEDNNGHSEKQWGDANVTPYLHTQRFKALIQHVTNTNTKPCTQWSASFKIISISCMKWQEAIFVGISELDIHTLPKKYAIKII